MPSIVMKESVVKYVHSFCLNSFADNYFVFITSTVLHFCQETLLIVLGDELLKLILFSFRQGSQTHMHFRVKFPGKMGRRLGEKWLRGPHLLSKPIKPQFLVEMLSTFWILKVSLAAETLLAGPVFETPDSRGMKFIWIIAILALIALISIPTQNPKNKILKKSLVRFSQIDQCSFFKYAFKIHSYSYKWKLLPTSKKILQQPLPNSKFSSFSNKVTVTKECKILFCFFQNQHH